MSGSGGSDFAPIGGLAAIGAVWLTGRWMWHRARYRRRVCPGCRGGRDFSGFVDGRFRVCGKCGGKGWI